MVKMIKTKLVKRNNNYVIQKADELGKYKQVASFDNELDAKVFRKSYRKSTKLSAVNNITVRQAYSNYADHKFDFGTLTINYTKLRFIKDIVDG